ARRRSTVRHRQADRPVLRYEPSRVWELRRPLQSRQRDFLRPGAPSRRLPRDERPLLRMGSRAEEQGDRRVRISMKNRLVFTCVACISFVVAQHSIGAQTIDWKAIGDEAIK